MQITNLETVLNRSKFEIFKNNDFQHQLIWPKLLYLGNPEDLRRGVGDIFSRKVMQITNLETVLNRSKFEIFKNNDFQHQLIWPKLLYLGNPEDLRRGVGDIFSRKVMQITNLETVLNRSKFEIFKNNDFQHQLIWPKLLYLGNPEDLRGGVGNIFSRKVMQITNLETVLNRSKFEIFKNNDFQHQLIWPKLLYLGNPEDLRRGVGDIFSRKVMQITNLETVLNRSKFEIFKNNDFSTSADLT